MFSKDLDEIHFFRFFPNCFLIAFNLVDTVPICTSKTDAINSPEWIRLGQYAGPRDQHDPTYAGAHLQVCGWLDCEGTVLLHYGFANAGVLCDMSHKIEVIEAQTLG